MKPADLINNFVEDYLVEELSNLGFSYSKSKIQFIRKLDRIYHRIEFSKSKWNQENIRAEFWTIWIVESDYYSKWHFEKYNVKPQNNLIFTSYDKHIKEWNRDLMGNIGRYNLVCENPELVMEKLKWNFINVGIPILNKYSTWESAANTIVNEDWKKHTPSLIKASDYFIIAGKKDKGYEPLLKAKQHFQDLNSKEPNSHYQNLLENIELRLKLNYN